MSEKNSQKLNAEFPFMETRGEIRTELLANIKSTITLKRVWLAIVVFGPLIC